MNDPLAGRKIGVNLGWQVRGVLNQMPDLHLNKVRVLGRFEWIVLSAGAIFIDEACGLGPDLKFGDFEGVMVAINQFVVIVIFTFIKCTNRYRYRPGEVINHLAAP